MVEVGVVSFVKPPIGRTSTGKDWSVGIGGRTKRITRNKSVFGGNGRQVIITDTPLTQTNNGNTDKGVEKTKSGGIRT